MIEQDLYLNTTVEQLKVRCPGCLKLYAVSTAEIFESKPKFSCVSCEQKFWIPYPDALEHKDALLGFPLEWIEPSPVEPPTEIAEDTSIEAKPFSCPTCGAPYAGGQKDCTSCGIIFEKFETRQRDIDLPEASPELRDLWNNVVDDYDTPARHDAFIGQALGEGSLAYAQYRYAQVVGVNQTDALAASALKKIGALNIAKVEAKIPVKEPMPFTLKLPKLRIGTLMLFLCGVVIALGLVIPGARNLVGMGSAFLFLLLALRYYFRII